MVCVCYTCEVDADFQWFCLVSTDLVPSSVPSRPTDREDRSLKRSLASASSPQQPISEGGQPSWMEVAKRKSLAWSDKSTTD